MTVAVTFKSQMKEYAIISKGLEILFTQRQAKASTAIGFLIDQDTSNVYCSNRPYIFCGCLKSVLLKISILHCVPLSFYCCYQNYYLSKIRWIYCLILFKVLKSSFQVTGVLNSIYYLILLSNLMCSREFTHVFLT